MNDKQEMNCLFETNVGDHEIHENLFNLDKDLIARLQEEFYRASSNDFRERICSGDLNKHKQTNSGGSFVRLDTAEDLDDVFKKLYHEPVHISKHFMPPPSPLPLTMKVLIENDSPRFVITRPDPDKSSFNNSESIEDVCDTLKLKKMLKAIQCEMNTSNPGLPVVFEIPRESLGQLPWDHCQTFVRTPNHNYNFAERGNNIQFDPSRNVTRIVKHTKNNQRDYFYFDLEGVPLYSHIHSLPSTRKMSDLLNMKQLGVIGQKSFQPKDKPWIHKRK